MHLLFKMISVLLCYPTKELKEATPELRKAVNGLPLLEKHRPELSQFLDYLDEHTLLELQMNYVNYFDLNRSHALYLFEHIHGEDRDRGMAMVDLVSEYEKHGFSIDANELPDYLPLVLEFLSEVDSEVANRLLADAINVIHHVGKRLTKDEIPYATLLTVVVALSPVRPVPLISPPVRDMDEAMDIFGVSDDGVEPLLTPNMSICRHRQSVQPSHLGQPIHAGIEE